MLGTTMRVIGGDPGCAGEISPALRSSTALPDDRQWWWRRRGDGGGKFPSAQHYPLDQVRVRVSVCYGFTTNFVQQALVPTFSL